MTRKQFEKMYPKTKIVKGVTLYRSYDLKGNVCYMSVPESE
jgi:hypothetical protein